MNTIRNWGYVAKRIYAGAHGIKINGIPVSQLLWVMPHMDETKALQLRDECINFVASCTVNNHYALIIAPIGQSEYQNHSRCLRFRHIDKPPIYLFYKKFPFNTPSLKEHGESPYPVAIILAKWQKDKLYLSGEDIALLWMTKNYLPCVSKSRIQTITLYMGKTKFLNVPLDCESGVLNDVVVNVEEKGQMRAIKITEPDPVFPWTPNAQ